MSQHAIRAPKRNSSIELLRILSMFMILQHHFVVHNGTKLFSFSPTFERMAYQIFFQGAGKVGVIIFFSISIWYLIDKDQTIRGCLKRIWLMDRELIFWSYTILAVTLILSRSTLPTSVDFIRSLAPLILDYWWYPTSYAIFLVVFPFLQEGLKKIGKRRHLQLALGLLVIYGIIGFIPIAPQLPFDSPLGFIYVCILVAAYKWYLHPLTTRQILLILGVGIVITAPFMIAANILPSHGHELTGFVLGTWRLPTILIGFSIFMLFERHTFYCAIINRIARSTFAVYLLTDNPVMRELLWSRYLNLNDVMSWHFSILRALLCLIAIYAICTCLDFIRQFLFHITVDRHPGKWFNALSNAILRRWQQFTTRHNLQKLSDDVSIQQ